MSKYNRIGIVLSGGGAKGAYQIGVFQALSDAGMIKSIRIASGCSIGSLNALLLADGRSLLWKYVWRLLSKGISGAGADSEAGAGEATEGLASTFTRLTSMKGVLDGGIELYACAYCISDSAPEYFRLNSLSPEDAGTVCAASCSMPGSFPSVKYKGREYCDGGMTPKDSGLDNADKIPVSPLRDKGCDLVIVSYLTLYDKVELAGFDPATELLELRPSRPLEDYPGEATLDFSYSRIKSHRRQGYEDTRRTLKEHGML